MLIDGKSRVSEKPVMTVSAYSIKGKRNHMEDYFDIGYQMKPPEQRRQNEWPYEYFYFGIFDGHGGFEAADFAKRNLLKSITRQKGFWSENDEDVLQAIRSGYADTHSAMKKDMPSWSRTPKVLPSTAGTTASVLFIRNGKFYTGHVGDSRIVVSRQNPETNHWISDQLTDDHKPESTKESERINRAGGQVRNRIGVDRVVWRRPVLSQCISNSPTDLDKNDDIMSSVSSYPISETLVSSYQVIPFLAIARSLGDFWSINPYSGQYVVSPEPDVSCRPITSEDKCILLATDGLWNVINSPQAIRMLQELSILKSGGTKFAKPECFITDNFYDVSGYDSENHAKSLVYFAYQSWSRKRMRSDNITVVVALLNDILTKFHSPNKAYVTRASVVQESDSLDPKESVPGIRQLEHSYKFFEKIRLDREPRFHTKPFTLSPSKWERLEEILIFPPTLLEQECDSKSYNLVCPRNYTRLSVAPCRRIPRLDSYDDSYIYIKRVSDDPADESEMPTRISRSGKEVKDASAQATQSIHDFGQPWNQLLDEDEEENDFEDEEDIYEDEDDIFEETTADDETLDFEEPIESIKEAQEDEKSIPQLRCLLNCISPLRRSTRSLHISMSDNAKRKVHTTASHPGSKRRKSQPISCNLSRV